jgi:hypothetical protein
MTDLALIQEILSVMSFNPKSDGLSLIDVTGGAGGCGTGRGGAVKLSSTEITVVPALLNGVDGGSGTGAKSTDLEDGADKGVNGAPPIFHDSWMVIDKILPWLAMLPPMKPPIKTLSGTQ